MSSDASKPPREAGRIVLDLDTADVIAARDADVRASLARRLRRGGTDGIYDQVPGPAASTSDQAVQRQVLEDAQKDRGRDK